MATLLAALGIPPDDAIAKHLDAKFDFASAKVEGEQILATCKDSVIFAVRYNSLNLEYDKPEKKESGPSKLWRIITRAPKSGKITKVTLGEGFVGRGINAFAGTADPQVEEGLEDNIFYRRPVRVRNGTTNDLHTNGNAAT